MATCPSCKTAVDLSLAVNGSVSCSGCGRSLRFTSTQKPVPPVFSGRAADAVPDEWWMTRNGQRFGPYSVLQLKEFASRGNLLADDLVWTEGMPSWSRANSALTNITFPPPTPNFSSAAEPPRPGQSRTDVFGIKLAAGLCGIFLGSLGIHKFVVGNTRAGVITLAIYFGCLFTGMILILPLLGCFAIWIIGLIEGISYLTKTEEEFKQTYLDNKRDWF